MTDYQDIILEFKDGCKVYIPKDLQLFRLAPSVVCQIGQRIKSLRSLLTQLEADGEISVNTVRKFDQIIAPLPLEDRLLSGNVVELHDAIIQLCSEQ